MLLLRLAQGCVHGVLEGLQWLKRGRLARRQVRLVGGVVFLRFRVHLVGIVRVLQLVLLQLKLRLRRGRCLLLL